MKMGTSLKPDNRPLGVRAADRLEANDEATFRKRAIQSGFSETEIEQLVSVYRMYWQEEWK